MTTDDLQFYPTPKSLLDKICIDFSRFIPNGGKFLECSAGNGDVCDYFEGRWQSILRYRNQDRFLFECIELDKTRQATLRGKGYPVVFDDFLKFHTYTTYDIAFLNPPFANGEKHLLKAIELQERFGGNIICVLNSETLRNPFSQSRKEVIEKIKKYNGLIKEYGQAFNESDAERRAEAEISVVGLNIPTPKSYFKSNLFDRMDKDKKAWEIEYEKSEDSKELIDSGLGYIDAFIRDYNEEMAAGLELIREFDAYRSIANDRFSTEGYNVSLYYKRNNYSGCMLSLSLNDKSANFNDFVSGVRRKYWHLLFDNPNFSGKLSSKMRADFETQLNEMDSYEFNVHNILILFEEIRSQTLKGIEDCILNLFDTCSCEHSYFDGSKNIHLYNGWKSNSAHKVNKKVVIPMRSRYWFSEKDYIRDYEAVDGLKDLVKAFDYLADGTYAGIDTKTDLECAIKSSFEKNIYKGIETKYMILDFFKKGTVHITFKDDKLLEKFNLFCGKTRGWLPPDYGKKAYVDMDEEEKELVKGFSGEKKKYDEIVKNASYYLAADSL